MASMDDLRMPKQHSRDSISSPIASKLAPQPKTLSAFLDVAKSVDFSNRGYFSLARFSSAGIEAQSSKKGHKSASRCRKLISKFKSIKKDKKIGRRNERSPLDKEKDEGQNAVVRKISNVGRSFSFYSESGRTSRNNFGRACKYKNPVAGESWTFNALDFVNWNSLFSNNKNSPLLRRDSISSELYADCLSTSVENLPLSARRNALTTESQLPSLQGLRSRIYRMQQEKAMAAVPDLPIEVNRFASYVHERRKKPILYRGELIMIKKSAENFRMDYAKMKEVEDRNHYPEVLPYDYNRVSLPGFGSDPYSHYINASYVDSFSQQKAYVVTQSVKSKQGCTDLWRMIWELNSKCVVMLTKIFDFMKVMCMQYWPMNAETYGTIRVVTLETKHYAYFIIRTFQLNKMDSEGKEIPNCAKRIVRHFHFTEWEATAFPYVTALLDFRRRIRNYCKQLTDNGGYTGPMIVHCSNGGERSGIFLAIDANLELAYSEGLIDVFGYCKILINARQHLITNLEQYIAIYEAVAEGVSCSLQPISCEELKTRGALYTTKQSRKEIEAHQAEEYKVLCLWTAPLRIGDCAGGHRLENRSKNRDVMVVPPDYARPYLSTLHGESKDYTYINAFFVDGFTKKNEWLITEWPKQQTIDSFWTLIFDHLCQSVINLTNTNGKSKTYPQYVHNKGRQIYGPFVVDVVYYRNFPYMTLHTVKMMKKTLIFQDLLGLSSLKHNPQETDSHSCHLIQVKTWPLASKVPMSTASLIDLIKIVRELTRQTATDKTELKPVVVMSHNGISRCGIFIAAQIVIDQMEMDNEVDIFRACKSVRLNRPQLIDSKEEFKYLYDFILHYVNLYDEYRRDGKTLALKDEAYRQLFGEPQNQ